MKQDFLHRYRGSFSGILQWRDFDALWDRLHDVGDDAMAIWYVYRVGEAPPVLPVTPDKWHEFLNSVALQLKTGHKEDYCGLVYVDNLEQPSLIKIYDPDNMGVVCGFSNQPPLPGWVLSQLAPVDLLAIMVPTPKPWWRRILPWAILSGL